MAVTLTGTGGAFTRLGKIAKTINDVDALVGGSTDTRMTTMAAEYVTNEREQFAPLWTARDSWRTAGDGWRSDLFALAADGLVAQVDRDVTLLNLTVDEAVAEVVRQMKSSSDSLNRPVLTATVTAAGGNVGDTTVITTATDGDGLPLDCLFTESIPLRCTAADANAPFVETLSGEGNPSVSESAYNWPKGSGASVSLTTINPAGDSLVRDGSFEEWDGTNVNLPQQWTIATGTVTTHVQRSSAAPRRGLYNLRLVSDGTTLTKLRQTFPAFLQPLTLYAVTFTARINTVDATGTFRVALVDGGGAVVNDAVGVANAVSVGVNGGSGIGATYAQFTAWFRTPAKASTAWQLEFGFTASPTSGRTVDVDCVAVALPTQLYAGGPWLAAFGNSVTPVVGDTWTLAYTNSLGTDSLVRCCDRLFRTRELGVKIPTAVSETIADTLIA